MTNSSESDADNLRKPAGSVLSSMPQDLNDFILEIGLNEDQALKEVARLSGQLLEGTGYVSSHGGSARTGEGETVLVIKTASYPWEVLDDQTLSAVYRDYSSVRRVLYMPLGYPLSVSGNDIGWESNNLTGNLKALASEICDPSVAVLHLQIGPHTKSEFLLLIARFLRPDIRIAVEFYDMGALFSVSYLAGVRGFDRDEVAVTRLAAWMAARQADAVIQKVDGVEADKLHSSFKSDVFVWNPMHNVLSTACGSNQKTLGEDPHFSMNEQKRSVVFAGSLSDTEIVHGADAAPSANIVETLAGLMRDERISVAVYNAADRRRWEPVVQKFERVEAWMNGFGPDHQYNPAVAQNELLAELAGYDFGFFCVHYHGGGVQHIGRLAIPNRVMAYVIAGLPIIVDSYAKTVADWVNEFNAGIVVDPSKFDTLPNRVASADLAALRAGANALREELLGRNCGTLQALQARVSSWRE